MGVSTKSCGESGENREDGNLTMGSHMISGGTAHDVGWIKGLFGSRTNSPQPNLRHATFC
jgi:hypothetical protein